MKNEELARIAADYGKYLSDYIARSVKNSQDREDILQEVWLRLLNSSVGDLNLERTAGYLRCVAMCVKKEYYRQYSRSVYTREIPDWQLRHIATVPDGLTSFESEYCLAVLKVAKKRLPPHHKRYVEDYYINEHSIEVIASNNGKSYEAVRKPVADFAGELRKIYHKNI